MIRQPGTGTRNVNDTFYKSESQNIAKLNEIFGNVDLTDDEERVLIWLAGYDKWTIDNVVSAFKKAVSSGRNDKGRIGENGKSKMSKV